MAVSPVVFTPAKLVTLTVTGYGNCRELNVCVPPKPIGCILTPSVTLWGGGGALIKRTLQPSVVPSPW